MPRNEDRWILLYLNVRVDFSEEEWKDEADGAA